MDGFLRFLGCDEFVGFEEVCRAAGHCEEFAGATGIHMGSYHHPLCSPGRPDKTVLRYYTRYNVLQREVGRFTPPGRSQGCLTALVAAIFAFLGLSAVVLHLAR